MEPWLSGDPQCRDQGDKQRRTSGHSAAVGKRGLAGDLSQPARRALSGDLAGRPELADRPAGTRARAHAAVAVAHEISAGASAFAVARRAGRDELAGRILVAARRTEAISKQDIRSRLRPIPGKRR